MPKFYFHLREADGVVIDSEGLDLPDADAAHARAIAETKGLLAVELCDSPVVDLTRIIDVTDESGAMIHSFRFDEIIMVMRRDQNAHGQQHI